MKNKEEFKERFENGEFSEEFKNITSAEDVVKLAEKLGYELTIEDVLTAGLDEDKLALVAGGKGDTHNNTTTNNNNNIIRGNNNTQFTF